MKISKSTITLTIIILLAATLRLVKLSQIPVGFNDDEAAFGYNAYSILKTGRDEWGRLLPFPIFESFGDWKLVGYLYLTVPSIAVFGVNEFATRLPSAVFGILIVVATYLLTKKLFDQSLTGERSSLKNMTLQQSQGKRGVTRLEGLPTARSPAVFLEFAYRIIKRALTGGKVEAGPRAINSDSIAIIAALFLAISPWHIIASRNAFESDVMILPITLGLYFFLKGAKDLKFAALAVICFAISFYFYRSSWLFVPLFTASLIYIFRKELFKNKRFLTESIFLGIIVLLPLVPTVLTFKGQARFFQESLIFSVTRSGLIDEINVRRGTCYPKLPDLLCSATYNRYTFYITTYLNNYFSNLLPENYFLRANPTGYQSAPTRSFFYTFELPLFLAGLVFLIRRNDHIAKILITWLLLVPIGPSITAVGNPGRLNILMPTPQIITAFALVTIFNFLKKPHIKIVFGSFTALVVFFSFIRFVTDMLFYYPVVSARYQRYGYKQLFDYLESQKASYNQIALSRKNDDAKQYIHYLFFEKYNPKAYLESGETVKYRGTDSWQVVEKIGNLHFYPSAPAVESLPQKSLLVTQEKEVFYPSSPIRVFDDLRGDRLFDVYDVDQIKEKIKQHDETN